MNRTFKISVLCGFLLTGILSAETLQGVETLPIPDRFTAVLGTFVGGETAPVKATDGKWHVVYELWLTNGKHLPATIRRIDVLDYHDHNTILASLEGESLDVTQLSTRPVVKQGLEPNESTLVYVDLSFESEEDVPDKIVHRFSGTGASNPGSREPAEISYLFAPWDLSQRSPPSIAAPVRGNNWVAINGCCRRAGAHRGAVQTINGTLVDSQRFAIDWMRLDGQNQLADGDPSQLGNWISYNEPVYAIADSIVSEVYDGLDDQIPGQLPDSRTMSLETIDGNYVILELGNGVFAFYAHLIKGSISVTKGDTVKAGQQIGRLGNSGNTSAPHLHIHLMAGPSALGSDGIAYVYQQFNVTGAIDPDQWEATGADINNPWNIVNLDDPGPQENALPLDLRIVEFPEK